MEVPDGPYKIRQFASGDATSLTPSATSISTSTSTSTSTSNSSSINDLNTGWFIAPFYPAVLAVFILMLFVIFSTFLHYRWRAHRGMPPLFYQRCFARRSTRHPPAHAARWSPYEYGGGGRSTSEPQGGRLRGGAGSASTARSHADDGYDLENLQAPPPAYDPSMGPPPKYAHGGEEAKQHVGADVSGAAVESPGYQVMAPRVPAPYSDPRI